MKKYLPVILVLIFFPYLNANATWLQRIFSTYDDLHKEEEAHSQVLEEGEAVIEDTSTQEDVAVPIVEIPAEQSLPWQKPDYSASIGSLAYTANTFAIPESMKERVKFWIDIYTKYSMQQGVIHDALYINNVFDTVDFSDIMKNQSLSDRQKRKAKEKLVKEKKKAVQDRFEALQKVKDPSTLTGEDLRVWKMYESVPDAKKFSEAGKKGRLRFQLGQSDYYFKGIYNSGRYLKIMTEIFKEQGLPIELTRLPFVESSFNLSARSKVGASGIWQFMRSTGRLYMKVNAYMDQRNDPIMATRAAARKLKDNYNLTKAWPLAITGYNFGPSGIQRLSQKMGTKDIAEIIERGDAKRFGFASKNFYACFLAVIEIEKNADKYFKDPRWMQPFDAKEYKLEKPTSIRQLVSIYKGAEAQFSVLNPQFTSSALRSQFIVPKDTTIYLPKADFEVMITNIQKVDDHFKEQKLIAADPYGKVGEPYKVNRGDSLYTIARSFGISVQKLITHNDLDSKTIFEGQILRIPEK